MSVLSLDFHQATHPAADTQVLASLGAVSANTWYEVNLTSQITGDETYSLRVSDSQGGANYSLKEGANAPKLLVAVGGATPQSYSTTATATPTNTPTPVPAQHRRILLPLHLHPPPPSRLRVRSTVPPLCMMAMASA